MALMELLMETSDISALILQFVFKSSLEHGIVPGVWKIALSLK